MQKRVAPCAFAARAFAITSSTLSIGSPFTFVSWWDDCGQYAQSSGQPPVFTLSSVQSCTSSFGVVRHVNGAGPIEQLEERQIVDGSDLGSVQS